MPYWSTLTPDELGIFKTSAQKQQQDFLNKYDFGGNGNLDVALANYTTELNGQNQQPYDPLSGPQPSSVPHQPNFIEPSIAGHTPFSSRPLFGDSLWPSISNPEQAFGQLSYYQGEQPENTGHMKGYESSLKSWAPVIAALTLGYGGYALAPAMAAGGGGGAAGGGLAMSELGGAGGYGAGGYLEAGTTSGGSLLGGGTAAGETLGSISPTGGATVTAPAGGGSTVMAPTATQATVPWYEQAGKYVLNSLTNNWPSTALFAGMSVLDYFNSQKKAEQGKDVASQYLNQQAEQQAAYQNRLDTAYQNAVGQTDTNYDQYLKSYADVKEAAKPDIPGYTTALQGIISEQSEAAKRKAAERMAESGSGGGSYQKALDIIGQQGRETAARGLQPLYSGYNIPMPTLKPTVTQQTAGPVSPSYDALTALNASGTSDWMSRALGLGGQMLSQQQLMSMIQAMNKK